jgi:hypothetical protein
VARVGYQLENLKSVPKFERLLKRLMSKQEYLSAEAELEVAACFLQGRFHVEFYPSVGSREADLCIEAGGDKFYVEITVVGESQDAQRSSQTLNDLTWPFFPEHRYIAMSGRIYKSLSAPHIRELKNRIAAAIQETKDRHESQELIEPGVMELLISPRDKADELKSWQQQKRISGLQGPPIEVDEVRRIRNKLEQKNRQLPTNEPGLIIVYAHALISQFFEQNFHKSLVNQLQETVYEHENLILGAIIAYGSGSSTAATEKRDDYVLGHRQLYTPLMQEDVLLIRNKYSKFPINEAVMNALLYSTT